MKIEMILNEQLRRAVEILGSAEVQDDAMEAKVVELVASETLARRLTVWIPEVFGLILVSHIGKVHLPKTFSAKNSSGSWVEISLDAEPIFKAVVPIAMGMFHSEPRDAFRNISYRSAILAAANNALNAEGSIEGATLSGPALIGIPAETYVKREQSFWRRLFQ